MSDLQNEVRRRLRTKLKAAGFSDQRIGDAFGIDRTQAGRLLKDPTTGLTLDRLEILARLLHLPPVALLAAEGDEVQTLTPIELGILTRVREMTSEQRFALLMVLDWQRGKPVKLSRRRGSTPPGLSQTALLVAKGWQTASPDAQKLVSDLLALDLGEDSQLRRSATGAADDSEGENPAATQKSPHQR